MSVPIGEMNELQLLRLLVAGLVGLDANGVPRFTYPAFGAIPSVTYPITPDKGGTGVANNAASTLTISGNFGTTITVTGTTAVTLPTSGTLATLAGAEALTNKSYAGTTLSLLTTGGEIARFSYDLTHYCAATINSNGEVTWNQEPGFNHKFACNNTVIISIGSGGVNLTQGVWSISGASYAANLARFLLPDGVSGIGIPAASSVSLVANSVDVFTGTTTKNVSALPIQQKSYTVGTLPSASPASQEVYVSDAAVAPCLAFSNGTVWKRCDNAATTVI